MTELVIAGTLTTKPKLTWIRSLFVTARDCQALSGSAFRTVAVTVEDGFRLLSGELKIYVKTAESGKPRQQGFCPHCGSPVYSADDVDDPKSLIRN